MGASGHASDQARLNAAYDGPWINMVLINGWTVGAIQPQYMVNSRGIVRLRGRIVTPGGQVVVWNAPAGYLAPVGSLFFDWTLAGTDVANPSTMGTLTGGNALAVGYLNGGTVDPAAGKIVSLDRMMWTTF